MVIRFYCIYQSYKKRIAPTRDLSSGHPLQEAIEVLQTALRCTVILTGLIIKVSLLQVTTMLHTAVHVLWAEVSDTPT
jgi:hypothetical protein